MIKKFVFACMFLIILVAFAYACGGSGVDIAETGDDIPVFAEITIPERTEPSEQQTTPEIITEIITQTTQTTTTEICTEIVDDIVIEMREFFFNA